MTTSNTNTTDMQRFLSRMREAFMNALPETIGPEGTEIMEVITRDFEIPASWGLHAVEPSQDGVTFHVNGFLFQGKVSVRRNSDGKFDITLWRRDTAEVTPGTERERLTETLDLLVERDEHYRERVFETYIAR